MTVKKLVKILEKLPQNSKVLVASDEELNSLYRDIVVAKCEENTFVIYGNNLIEE